ncbi:MAG: glutathione peroxidase [Pseudomonadota bacterium]
MITRRAVVAALAVSPVTLHAGELSAHDFAFPNIDGGLLRLMDYAGQPVLVVNTASRCGFTSQYDGLQSLYSRYRDQGLVVLAVPSDDFNQELDSDAAVKEFCSVNFALDFPMAGITPVVGTGAHPFYAWARRELGPSRAPRWNFHKYLVGPRGELVGAFGTNVEPTSSQVTSAIEDLLSTG